MTDDDGLTVVNAALLVALFVVLLCAGFLAGVLTWLWWGQTRRPAACEPTGAADRGMADGALQRGETHENDR